MKFSNYIKNACITSLLFTITNNLSHAGIPLWTFIPLTPTTISVPKNRATTVEYQVTNQSNRTHILAMSGIAGVSQVTGSGEACNNPFTLSAHQSCTLKLLIDGSQVTSGNTNGPLVCEQGSSLQCYVPDPMNILNLSVTENVYSLGGTILGLSGTVYLQNNSENPQPFDSNGVFALENDLTNGSSYEVTVQSQPVSQTCSVAHGVGTVNNANVKNVIVTCANNAYTVGGTVSGLFGTVVLLNNGTNAETVTSNGSFTFSKPIAQDGTYEVTVGTQPAGQNCTVTNGSGTMSNSDVTNVAVNCVTNETTLTTSINNLALAVNGHSRIITITNTGSSDTTADLSVNYPNWPDGTTADSDCPSSLAAADSCTITINPGPTDGTSNCNNPYGSPTPGVITVSATNVASPVTTNVVVLGYGCIYQQGYIFSIDDTTPTNISIGGKIASLTNNATSIAWYNGNFVTTNASSLTNGLNCPQDSNGNTCKIINVQGSGNYAATTCANYSIDSAGNSPCSTGTCYENWYLPAICETSYVSGASAGCADGIQNINSNLQGLIVGCSGAACLTGNFWTSTEYDSSYAWSVVFSADPVQGFAAKSLNKLVRCTRYLTQ